MACCRSDDAVREATTPSIWWRAVEASAAADAAASEEGKNLTDDLYREAAASAHGVSLNLDKAKKCIDEINKLCETNKNKFFDPAFPCGTASLNRFSDRPAVRGSQDNTWSRATEANFAHQASSLNVDVTRCFHPQLATQVLALVGDKEDALYPAKFNRYGVYGVRVWAANSQEWRMVLVDDYLPSAVGSLLDSSRGALVLKALAKLHGSYQGIDAGAPLRCNIVNALTGWSPYDRITVAADVVRACREGLGATGLRLFTTVGLVAAEVTGTSDERGIQLKLPCVPNDAHVAADGPILWLSDADVANRGLFLDAYGVSSEALPGPLFVLTPKADLWSVALVEPDPPRLVHVLTEKTTCPRTIDGGSELATAPQWAITVSETTHVSLHATRGDANSIGAVFATGNTTTLKSGRVVDWLAAPIASSVNNEASPVVALAPGVYTIAVAVPTATHSPVTLKLQSDKALSWSLIPTPVIIRCRCAAAEDAGERVLRVTTASADAVEVLLDVYRQPVTLSTASPVKASIDVLTSRKSLRVMVSADKAAELREAVAVKQGLEVTAIVVGGSGQVEIRQA